MEPSRHQTRKRRRFQAVPGIPVFLVLGGVKSVRNRRQNLANVSAEQRQHGDRSDGHQSQDQRVLDQRLTVLVAN
jgi:heme exporter protein D